LVFFFWSEQILDGMSVSNKRLKLADVLPRAWEQKAVGVTEAALAGDKEEDNDGGEDHAMAEDVSGDESEKKSLEPYRNVTQVVTPLAHLPYEEQLGKKKEEIVQVLKRLVSLHTVSRKNLAQVLHSIRLHENVNLCVHFCPLSIRLCCLILGILKPSVPVYSLRPIILVPFCFFHLSQITYPLYVRPDFRDQR